MMIYNEGIMEENEATTKLKKKKKMMIKLKK